MSYAYQHHNGQKCQICRVNPRYNDGLCSPCYHKEQFTQAKLDKLNSFFLTATIIGAPVIVFLWVYYVS